MAGESGPQISIPLDLSALQDLKRMKEAAQAADKEIKQVQRTMRESVRQGQAIKPELTQRLAELEGVKTQYKEIVAAEKSVRAEFRGFKAAEKIAEARAVENLMRGNMDAQSLLYLVNHRTIAKAARALTAVGAERLGEAMKHFAHTAGPALFLADFSYEKIKGAFEEVHSDSEMQAKMREGLFTGEFTQAQGRLFAKAFNRMYWFGEAGKTAANLVKTAASAAHGVEALSDEEFGRATAKILGHSGNRENLADAIAERVASEEKRLGRFLTAEEREQEVQSVFANFLDNWSPEQAQALSDSINSAVSEHNTKAKPRQARRTQSDLFLEEEKDRWEELQFELRRPLKKASYYPEKFRD